MPDEQNMSAGRALFDRMCARLPAEVCASLTPLQLEGLAAALVQPAAEHLVDNRVSVRWLRKHYYVRLLIGHERRSLTRVMRERHLKLGPSIVLLGLAIWLMVSVGLVALFALLYFVKSAYGMDIFDVDPFLKACVFG